MPFYLRTCALLFDSLFLVCSNSYCHLHSVFSPMQVCCAWLHRGLDKLIKSTPKISHSCWRSFLWFDFQWFDPQGLYIQQRTAGDPNKLRESLPIFLQWCCLQHVRIQYYLQVGHVYSSVPGGSCLQQCKEWVMFTAVLQRDMFTVIKQVGHVYCRVTKGACLQ